MVLIVFMPLVATPVAASSPPTPSNMRILIKNPPRVAVFADILIRINERDLNFTAVNEYNLALFGLNAQSEIVGFNDNGFRSFTFHYRDATSDIRLGEPIQGRLYENSLAVRFGYGEREEFRTQFRDLLENYSDMKIALLDYAGNVISVSARFSLPSPRRGVSITGAWLGEEVFYNHMTGEITVNIGELRYNYLGNIIRPILYRSPLLVLSVIALFSVVLEIVTGICFGFRGKKMVLIVFANLLTLAFVVMFILWLHHWGFGNEDLFFLMLMLLIVVTYTAKILLYRISPIMKDISTRKTLQYSIIANTISFSFLVGAFLIIVIR